MSYYKILQNGVVVDANSVFLRWQERHRTLMVCAPERGQFIQATDQTIYRVPWLLSPPEEVASKYPMADAVEIDEEEYTALRAMLDSGQSPEDVSTPAPDPEPEEESPPDNSLDHLRQLKINEMSAACSAAITSGFDVALSDGQTHHFSLTVEDQLNLVSLSALLIQGHTHIPYHADGEPCRFFSIEDFQAVTNAATDWKALQESYFNSLKQYVLSIDNAEDLAAVTYGVSVPFEYQSDVLLALTGGDSG